MKNLKIIGLLFISGFAYGTQKFDSCTLLSNCSEVLSNSIVGSPQYSVPYYSSPGTKSTLTGLIPGTIGQVLTSSGTAGAPFWGPGGGGGGNVTLCGTNPVGIQFVDANSCKWCETVNTSGIMVTALLSCPATGFILKEDGTYILQEDGTKIMVE